MPSFPSGGEPPGRVAPTAGKYDDVESDGGEGRGDVAMRTTLDWEDD